VDRQRYLQDLKEIALDEKCAVPAYVLMTNHVHLLMTPTGSEQVARLMQSLERRSVRQRPLPPHRNAWRKTLQIVPDR
jgi:putative transposase